MFAWYANIGFRTFGVSNMLRTDFDVKVMHLMAEIQSKSNIQMSVIIMPWCCHLFIPFGWKAVRKMRSVKRSFDVVSVVIRHTNTHSITTCEAHRQFGVRSECFDVALYDVCMC